jgi:hypothetical protein
MIQHRRAERIVADLTEVMPGRPTQLHHRRPIDIFEAHERFRRMQDAVLGGPNGSAEQAPSEMVVAEHNRLLRTNDYRLETDGPHPRVELRQTVPTG